MLSKSISTSSCLEKHAFWQLLYLFCGLVFTFNSHEDVFSLIFRLKSEGALCWGLIIMPQNSLSMKAYSSCGIISLWWKCQFCWPCSAMCCKVWASGSLLLLSWALEAATWNSLQHYGTMKAVMEGIKSDGQWVLNWRTSRLCICSGVGMQVVLWEIWVAKRL